MSDQGILVYETERGQLVVVGADERTLRENFRRFHAENPQVYETLRRLAKQWVARHPGRPTGIGALFEVVRWEIAMATSGEPLKLNNNYRAFYARELMQNEPDLVGLFHTRKQRA
jgi:hypothetical protein